MFTCSLRTLWSEVRVLTVENLDMVTSLIFSLILYLDFVTRAALLKWSLQATAVLRRCIATKK